MQNSFQANRKLRTVLANGIIMGLYIVLSLLVRPVSSGMIQFRISEKFESPSRFQSQIDVGCFRRRYLF